jgi:hypothetical protein
VFPLAGCRRHSVLFRLICVGQPVRSLRGSVCTTGAAVRPDVVRCPYGLVCGTRDGDAWARSASRRRRISSAERLNVNSSVIQGASFAECGPPQPGSPRISGTSCSSRIIDIGALEFQACEADINGDGAVAADDVFAFLELWFSLPASADYNCDGVTGVADIFAYLNTWFETNSCSNANLFPIGELWTPRAP